jgi:Protein of unknown function (DUF3592)
MTNSFIGKLNLYKGKIMGIGAIIGIVAGFIFALVGVILLAFAIASRRKALRAKNWPVTQGVILSSEVREHQNIDAADEQSSTSYEPIVQYSYTINDVPYKASRIAYGANQFDRSTAQARVNLYLPGSPVSVHYNPVDPQETVLDPEANGSQAFLIIGMVFAALGLSVCCIAGLVGFATQMVKHG